ADADLRAARRVHQAVVLVAEYLVHVRRDRRQLARDSLEGRRNQRTAVYRPLELEDLRVRPQRHPGAIVQAPQPRVDLVELLDLRLSHPDLVLVRDVVYAEPA